MTRWLPLALVCLIIGNYLYIPLSESAGEPWKQHFTYAVFKVIGDISRVAEFFGFSPINTIRTCLPFYTWVTSWFVPSYDDVKVIKDVFDGVEVRIYYPPSAASDNLLPAVMYFHGGGWTYLDGDAYVSLNRRITRTSNVVTVFVEYRKAPEHIFPAAFDDCFKATTYLFKHSVKYGIDRKRIGLAGDSAGGNLALAVSFKLTKTSDFPPIRFQCLIYPTVQALDFTLQSFEMNNPPVRRENTFVTKTLMIFWVNIYAFGHLKYQDAFFNNSHMSIATKQQYRKYVDPMLLPEKFRTNVDDSIAPSLPNYKDIEKILLNPYFAPLMMTDEQLRKMPKALIMTCDLDGLRDEGYILAERMRRVNVPVVHKHYEGADHAFIWLTYYESYKKGIEDLTRYITENI